MGLINCVLLDLIHIAISEILGQKVSNLSVVNDLLAISCLLNESL